MAVWVPYRRVRQVVAACAEVDRGDGCRRLEAWVVHVNACRVRLSIQHTCRATRGVCNRRGANHAHTASCGRAAGPRACAGTQGTAMCMLRVLSLSHSHLGLLHILIVPQQFVIEKRTAVGTPSAQASVRRACLTVRCCAVQACLSSSTGGAARRSKPVDCAKRSFSAARFCSE